ncbi:unnamed protein product [Ranitomeya imitator]|uniref:GIY-YIG domain-containing protein n=1 Tax=Ranitomeya imitator TaxID=111125 RepID=A0ABN9M8S0_9NEOB|nr:unnamed protein product [Ranitomeya imitator]
MLKGDSFHHPHTVKKFWIRDRYTCSNFVIYLITCSCSLMYIGETTMEIRARISKHKSTIQTKLLDLPGAKTFLVIDWAPIQRRGGVRVKILRKKGLRWIASLDTLQPRGLNCVL